MASKTSPGLPPLNPFESIVDFSKSILKRLHINTKDESLIPDLEQQISFVRQQARTLSSITSNVVNNHGALVWNAALNLNPDDAITDSKLVVLLRVFAFILIDHAQRPNKYSIDARLVVFRSANVTMRDLLDNGIQLGPNDIWEWIYRRAGDYEDSLDKELTIMSEDNRLELKKRKSECRLLRITMAWKQGKLEIAYNLFAQLTASQFDNDPEGAEDAADLAYEVGRQIFNSNDAYQAVKWLELSDSHISQHKIEELSEDAPDLHLRITKQLISALLRLPNGNGVDQASGLIQRLDQETPRNMATSMLKLDLLLATENSDPVLYYEELLRLICSANITQDTFETIMGHVNRLKKQNVGLAVKALNEFIDMLLEQSVECQGWLEAAMANRIWIAMDRPDSDPQSHQHIVSMFDLTWDDLHTQMGAEAAAASLILLWKHINVLVEQNKHREAIDWCNLGLHPVLALAGPQNLAKFRRKAMHCALELRDAVLAQGYFDTMPPASQGDVLSQYMLYRTAQLSGDDETAAKCFDTIYKLHSQGDEET